MKVRFTAILKKFAENGDKTGWTYLEVPEAESRRLHPADRKAFKVKGLLDDFAIRQVTLLPVKDAGYMMPVNAAMRKGIGKRQGAKVAVTLEPDADAYQMNEDFMACLADEPRAEAFFSTLAPSHQRYFSKWIDDAKTDETRARRIAQAVNALAAHFEYGPMIRALKEDKERF
ncbi:YdeI/OmpD-associated family protein [Chitinophaga lutea]